MIPNLIKTKKLIFVLAIWAFALKANAQIFNYSSFFNSNAKQIKTDIEQNGGKLKADRFVTYFDGKPQRLLLFDFPKVEFESGDTHSAWFFLTKTDSCVKFMFWHHGNKQLDKITKEFDDPKSGFKRIDNNLKWRNAQAEIQILPVKTSSMPDGGGVVSGFSVQGVILLQAN